MPKVKPNKILEEITTDSYTLLLDTNNDAYISFNNKPFIAHLVGSTAANGILRTIYIKYQQDNEADGNHNTPDLLKRHLDEFNDKMQSLAFAQNQERITHFWVRVAQNKDRTYYDMADNKSVLEIDSKGIRKIDSVPVYFRRTKSIQSAQCEYVDTDIQNVYKIFEYINIQDKESQLLLITYIVSLLNPVIHKYMLFLHGLKGSSKTTTFRIIKSLIDPSHDRSNPAYDAALPDQPAQDEDMYLHTTRHYLLYFDNVNNLRKSTQTLLTKMITGASIEKRKLYTDNETKRYSNKPALGLNGVNQIIDRDELIQRCLILEVDRVKERKTEREFWKRFYKQDKQIIFSAIIKLYSKALAHLEIDSIDSSKLPRMSDASKLMTCAALALGYTQTEFLDILKKNIIRQDIESIEYSPTARAIIIFMDSLKNSDYTWSGSASQLHRKIKAEIKAEQMNFNSDIQQVGLSSKYQDLVVGSKNDQFPSSVQSFGHKMREVTENLANLGYVIDRIRSRSGTTYKLTNVKKLKKENKYVSEADNE